MEPCTRGYCSNVGPFTDEFTLSIEILLDMALDMLLDMVLDMLLDILLDMRLDILLDIRGYCPALPECAITA